jgi:small subunit ribosomal protein S13
MARISGVDLPKDKRVDIAISYLYGIGRKLGADIIAEAQIDPATRVKNLTEAEVNKISSIIQTREIRVEGDLRRDIQANVRRLMDIGAYRGFRHRRNLPCRGQRTKTNARTRRGRRKTVGSARAEKPASAGAKPAAAPAGK